MADHAPHSGIGRWSQGWYPRMAVGNQAGEWLPKQFAEQPKDFPDRWGQYTGMQRYGSTLVRLREPTRSYSQPSSRVSTPPSYKPVTLDWSTPTGLPDTRAFAAMAPAGVSTW